jgi:hypothetical protein
VIATSPASGFRQPTNPADLKTIREGLIMFEDKEYLVEAGVIYTELEIEEMEEIVAPSSYVAN